MTPRQSLAIRILVPKSAALVMGALGSDPDDIIGAPWCYWLTRLRRGTEIFIRFGRLNVNYSIHCKVWPSDFAAARAHMQDLSARLGLPIPERARRRQPAKLRLVKE